MFKISSFNIRCYGLGGEYNGRFRDEKRNQNLKKIVQKYFSDCDVMIFQEIVDVESFTQLLPQGCELRTYPHDYNRHQHVVICYKSKYELLDTQGTQYSIPGVAIEDQRSRPAMYGLLIDRKSQKPCLHVIGVHLKSGILHTENRMLQANAIVKCIESLKPSLPIVIAGDFNTKPESKDMPGDISLLNNCFSKVGLQKIENTINIIKKLSTALTLFIRVC